MGVGISTAGVLLDCLTGAFTRVKVNPDDYKPQTGDDLEQLEAQVEYEKYVDKKLAVEKQIKDLEEKRKTAPKEPGKEANKENGGKPSSSEKKPEQEKKLEKEKKGNQSFSGTAEDPTPRDENGIALWETTDMAKFYGQVLGKNTKHLIRRLEDIEEEVFRDGVAEELSKNFHDFKEVLREIRDIRELKTRRTKEGAEENELNQIEDELTSAKDNRNNLQNRALEILRTKLNIE
jgi:hypothetical protein